MNQEEPTSMSSGVSVSHAALCLHKLNSPELRWKIPEGIILAELEDAEGYAVSADAIEFASLADRNIWAVLAAVAEVADGESPEPDTLFAKAYELWTDEIGHADQASGRLLAIASKRIDIVAVAAGRIRAGADVFDTLHLVEAALPYLETLDCASVIGLCSASFESTRNDLAGGCVHSAFETWLEQRPDVAVELHGRVLGGLTEATASLLCNAVVALAKSDFAAAFELARKDVRADELLRSQAGLWTLGRLVLEERATSQQRALAEALIVDFIQSANGDIRSQAIRAATKAIHATSAFDPLLERLARAGDQAVLCGVATALFLRADEMRARGKTYEWLDLMSELQPSFKGAVRDLDNAMARLLVDPENAPHVVSALTNWAAIHVESTPIDWTVAELFNHTARKLCGIQEAWSELMTNWLLSDRQQLAPSLAGLLGQATHRAPAGLRLSMRRLDTLSKGDLLFLARRMLGYVHDREQVTALALSMLDTRDAKERVYPLLRALLVDEIGYDYPGSTIATCQSAADSRSSTDDKVLLQHIAQTLEDREKGLRELPTLNELRPPTKLRRLFARARAKQMSDSFEEASKDSIWRAIATEIPIKAGQGTFSYRDDSYGPSMKLSSMSRSIELPHREVLDPIGNSIRHLGFRRVSRDES